MRRLLLSLAFLAAFIAPACAEDFTRAQIEQIVGEYIATHPKELMDSVQKYGEQQQSAEQEEASKAVIANRAWLEQNPNHAEAGNPKGDVTIVEFFDYNCGYCKQALGDLMTILDKDKGVRLVFVEIPILGDSSMLAAQWALAANRQKLYLEYHIGLMRFRGPITEDILTTQAQTAGLNVERLKKDKGDPKINTIIAENLNMARALGIQGTPAFVVGDQLIRGYVGLSGMEEAIANARAAKAKK
jgi:protein-disulfide isomerase